MGRLQRGGGVSYLWKKHTWEKNSKCKVLGAGAFQEGLRNGKGTSVARAESGGRFYERRGET